MNPGVILTGSKFNVTPAFTNSETDQSSDKECEQRKENNLCFFKLYMYSHPVICKRSSSILK